MLGSVCVCVWEGVVLLVTALSRELDHFLDPRKLGDEHKENVRVSRKAPHPRRVV